MSTIRPTPPPAPVVAAATPKKTSAAPGAQTRSVTASPEMKAQEAARERLARAQQEVERTQQEMEQRVDYIRENYQRQAMDEEIRQEASLDQQHAKGYEKIRELQKSQTKELARVQKQGDQQLEATKRHYEDAINSTDKRGRTDLEKLQTKYVNQIEAEKKVSDIWLADNRAQQASHFERSRNDREGKLQQATEAYQKEFERLRTNSAQASEQAEEQFKARVSATMERHDDILNRINARGSEIVSEVRQNTARKLAAYNSRQSDPFYKMVDFNASLEDEGEAFVLRAQVPEHEQHNISVTVKGNNQLMVTGYRRNEEKLELSPGRGKSTSSYQSFSETFPLPAPVNARLVSKEFDGDELVITIPKMAATYVARAAYKGPKPEKARVERPKFPDNIPDGKTAQVDPAAKPPRGSRPLG